VLLRGPCACRRCRSPSDRRDLDRRQFPRSRPHGRRTGTAADCRRRRAVPGQPGRQPDRATAVRPHPLVRRAGHAADHVHAVAVRNRRQRPPRGLRPRLVPLAPRGGHERRAGRSAAAAADGIPGGSLGRRYAGHRVQRPDQRHDRRRLGPAAQRRDAAGRAAEGCGRRQAAHPVSYHRPGNLQRPVGNRDDVPPPRRRARRGRRLSRPHRPGRAGDRPGRRGSAMKRVALLAVVLLLPVTPAAAQDAARDPHDLSGMWEAERFFFRVDDPPLLPEAKAMVDGYAERMRAGQIIYTGWTSCRPGAANAMVMTMNTIAILQTADEITLLYEEPRMNRRIRLNAEHPANLEPSYLGHSIGHWEGDTLVVDTIGYNGQFELDTFGLPTSTRMHTIERFTPSADGKRIDITITFEDPEFY